MSIVVVVEIRGGVLQGGYCDRTDVRLVLVDWDNIRAGEDAEGYVYLEPLSAMSRQTRAQVALAMEGA